MTTSIDVISLLMKQNYKMQGEKIWCQILFDFLVTGWMANGHGTELWKCEWDYWETTSTLGAANKINLRFGKTRNTSKVIQGNYWSPNYTWCQVINHKWSLAGTNVNEVKRTGERGKNNTRLSNRNISALQRLKILQSVKTLLQLDPFICLSSHA